MNVLSVLQRTAEFLAKKGIENARREAEWILSHELGMSRLNLYLQFERELTEQELERLREKVRKRAQRIPLAYVLGSAVFCGIELKVSPAVLIPRPETELLAEESFLWVKEYSKQLDRSIRILDIGTGSGCLAIFFALKFPNAEVVAVDISKDALELAKENARHYEVEDRIKFILSDVFSAIPTDFKFDLIVSNPPYIPTDQIEFLQPEVKDYEPRVAIDGGKDGLSVIKKIAKEGINFIKPGGRLYMEFAFGQADQIKDLFSRLGWRILSIIPDLQNIPRILVAFVE